MFAVPAKYWPPPANGYTDLKARFGDIVVDRLRGSVVGPAGWESHNMAMLPALPMWPRRLYVNRAIVEPLNDALMACQALGDGYVLKTLGCFAPRAKRVNSDLSIHSWGLAVDVNADDNPLAKARGPVVAAGTPGRTLPDAWVACWEQVGWVWGGRFPTPDPMHFQWAEHC